MGKTSANNQSADVFKILLTFFDNLARTGLDIVRQVKHLQAKDSLNPLGTLKSLFLRQSH